MNTTKTKAACLVAALGCTAALTASAQAQLLGADTIQDLGAAAQAPAGARVLQAGQTVGDADVARLLTELKLAGSAPVVLLVPGSAAAELSDDSLTALAGARNDATFVVVQQGDADIDGAAAILEASADQSYLQPGAKPPSGIPGAVWQKVQPRPDCAGGCLATQPVAAAPAALGLSAGSPTVRSELGDPTEQLGSALAAPVPGHRSINLRLVVLIVLVLAGLVAVVVLARARRPRAHEPSPDVVAVPPRRERASSPPPDRAAPRRPVALPPRQSVGGQRGEVVSVLDPEGYVELDRCLRRVRWGSPGDAPAVPGDRVDVQDGAGRLWAFPVRELQSEKSTA